jgi:hypothetical protein
VSEDVVDLQVFLSETEPLSSYVIIAQFLQGDLDLSDSHECLTHPQKVTGQ